MELCIFVRFHAREGREEAVAAALREVAGPTQAEPGCVMMGAFRSNGDKALFYVHSRWHDEAAFERHGTMPHTLRFLETVASLVDQPIEVTRAQAIA